MINEKLLSDFRAIGITDNDTILMHSSLSSLGYVVGGAQTVADSLLAALSNGTLLVPSLSFDSVTRENPYFSSADTPSCVGVISEYFRKRPDCMRSIHPTHSVCAVGKYAFELTDRHIEDATPVGKNSPFALLPQYGGKILMLGCGLRPNTSMHGVEELTIPPYLFADDTMEYRITDGKGKEFTKRYTVHNFRNTVQRYDRVADIIDVKYAKILNADAYLIDAKNMWEMLMKS